MADKAKAEKLRELDSNELRNQLRDSGEQMFRLRFQLTMGQTDGLKKLRVLRKDRARIQTILRGRELNPGSEPAPKPKKRGR